MASLTETLTEIGDKLDTSCTYIPLKYSDNAKVANNLAINVRFVLKRKIRLILSNPNEQVMREFVKESPLTKSPNIKWVQEKGLSTQDMRNKLYEIGVTRREIQNIAIQKVESYVDSIVERYQSRLDNRCSSLYKLDMELFLPIYRVYEFRGVLSERVEETIDEDEQCSFCFEKFVEQEQLRVAV